mgnify:FL=1
MYQKSADLRHIGSLSKKGKLQTVVADVYGVNSIPDNILINPEGKIVARGLRGTELDAFLSSVL